MSKIGKQIANNSVAAVRDPDFFAECYGKLAALNREKRQERSQIEDICLKEYVHLSTLLDQTKIQESVSVRNNLRARDLANMIINDEGQVDQACLKEAIDQIGKGLYALDLGRQVEFRRQQQIYQVLTLLLERKDLEALLMQFNVPYQNKRAERVIRDTLLLDEKEKLTDTHVKRAVLSAWMCYLRQNVGSCFATAPSIIVHTEQPELFLSDLKELLATGRIKRTFGGVEYSAPISTSWGAGDLKKPFPITKDPSHSPIPIWISPGMVAALKGINLIDSDLDESSTHQEAKAIICKAVEGLDKKEDVFYTNAEEILKQAIMQSLEITPKDIEQYEMRPKGLMHTDIVMRVPPSSASMKSKSQKIKNFYPLLELAQSRFKSLTDNAMLRTWEFTVASFAETKPQFAKWNLYSSLGLAPDDEGGIGMRMFEFLKSKLDERNSIVQENQDKYEEVFGQVKYLEERIRRSSTEQEMKFLKGDYQQRVAELHHWEGLRDKANHDAQRIANLFDQVVHKLDELFPEFFQEVYDADLHDVSPGPYDDSPAGFRLLYKAGRANTDLWQLIKTPGDFIDALAGFFVAIEPRLSHDEEFEGLEDVVGQMITVIVTHVKTEDFLETSFFRMAKVHRTPVVKKPLENLDKVEKKPWAYTSGGTMDSLVSCYFGREQKPTEKSRWIGEEIELAVFLIDILKGLPYRLTEEFIKNSNKSLLMHSPTHAFLLKPGLGLFKKAWNTDVYTYTWVRDTFILPQKRFIDQIVLDTQMIQYFLNRIAVQIPSDFTPLFKQVFQSHPMSMKVVEFRNYLIKTLNKGGQLRMLLHSYLSPDSIDSFLYRNIPLIHVKQLRGRVKEILNAIDAFDERDVEEMVTIFDAGSKASEQKMINSHQLHSIVLSLIMLHREETSSSTNWISTVREAMEKLKLCISMPLIFADTNWVEHHFAFVVNPGSGLFELWRMDELGIEGSPMSGWKQWLNGSRKDRKWGVYTQSYEYKRKV